MSDDKRYDNRTSDEIIADLESRRKDHVFMTTEQALEWNKKQAPKPYGDSHWTVKAGKVRHVLRMGASWKRLAKALWADHQKLQEHFDILEEDFNRVFRMLQRCDKCGASAGSKCNLGCSKDGIRDT